MSTLVQRCPSHAPEIWVNVLDAADLSAIEGATIDLRGPSSQQQSTPANGGVGFESVSPGDYEVSVGVEGLAVAAQAPAPQRCVADQGDRRTLVFYVEILGWDITDLCIPGAPLSTPAAPVDDDWDITDMSAGGIVVTTPLRTSPSSPSPTADWDVGDIQVASS